MESNDYAKRILDIKNEIVEEIRKLVPEDSAHRFSDKFYVHYIEGEVATTEVCSAVEVWHGGMVVFIVNHLKEFAKKEVIEGDAIYRYEPESFLDILDHLRKEVREKKLAYIRDIVKSHNGRIEFDNKFRFTGFDGDTECEFVGLLSLSLKENGKLCIEDEWQDGLYENSENFIPDTELDRFIEYVRNQTGNNVALTEKQEDAVQGFIAAYNTLKKLNVCIIRDNADDKLHFLNGEKVEEFIPADIGSVKADYAIDVTDQMLKNTSCEPIITNAYYSNDGEHVYAKPLKS
jgi:hypothetical protein